MHHQIEIAMFKFMLYQSFMRSQVFPSAWAAPEIFSYSDFFKWLLPGTISIITFRLQ